MNDEQNKKGKIPMSSLALNVRKLNQMIEQKQILEAIERYYDDEVVMAEAGGEPTVGKQANTERERMFAEGLTSWKATLHSSAVDEETGTALNEWTLDYNHKLWGSATMRQVAVQKWRDGRIVQEFFYKF